MLNQDYFLFGPGSTITALSHLITVTVLSSLISHQAILGFMIQTMTMGVNKGWLRAEPAWGLQISGRWRNKWVSLDDPLSKRQWGQYRVKARAKERAKNSEGCLVQPEHLCLFVSPQSKATRCIRLQSIFRAQGQPSGLRRGGGEIWSFNLSSSVAAHSFSIQRKRQWMKHCATYEPAQSTSLWQVHTENTNIPRIILKSGILAAWSRVPHT